MPDWSYQPLFRTVPPRVLLRAAGALAALPGGGRLIAAIGDTRTPPGFASPVSIVSKDGTGLRALARLGAGRIEVGPVAPGDRAAVEERIARAGALPVPVTIRDAPWTPAHLVDEPAAALAALDAGADVVRVRRGLVTAGPGLPRRINEAVAGRTARTASAPHRAAAALGLGMLFSGLVAWLVATGPVVLPYDEAFVDLTREELVALNDRLLPFMAHDRVTLAGVMIAIGALYYGLATGGIAGGARWAWSALRVSAAIGFLSLLLFLGFGYFDPLHGLLCALLLPSFLLALRRPPPDGFAPVAVPDLHNDRAWRLAQYGQLALVAVAAGVLAGGAGIAVIGVTDVFVASDLAFLGTTPDELHRASDGLVALVAHDRAGFGGALVSAAAGLLVVALRGVRRGQRWLWWTLLVGGAPAFAATLAVHLSVGYDDLLHLAPVLVGAVLYAVALACLFPFLAGDRPPRTAPAPRYAPGRSMSSIR